MGSQVEPCVKPAVLICWKEEEHFDIHPPLLSHKIRALICHDSNFITSQVPHSSEDVVFAKVDKPNTVQLKAS